VQAMPSSEKLEIESQNATKTDDPCFTEIIINFRPRVLKKVLNLTEIVQNIIGSLTIILIC
jgi:hypothetical protein